MRHLISNQTITQLSMHDRKAQKGRRNEKKNETKNGTNTKILNS